MSSNTVIATGRLVEAATITAVSEASAGNLGVTNLAHIQPKRRWRAPDLGGIDVTFDLTEAFEESGIFAYQLIAPLYHTATTSGVWEFFLANNEADTLSSGTADYYSGILDLWSGEDTLHLKRRHAWHWLPTVRSEPWVRIKITDPTNPAGFVDVGNLIIDAGYNPTLALVPTSPMAGVQEEVREVITAAGIRHRQVRPRPRTRSLTLQAVGPTARTEFETNVLALQEIRGVSESVFVLLDHAAAQLQQNVAVYGLLDQLNPILLGDPWHRYECQMNLTELL